MKNDHSIVQDLLPLYLENMVSDDTADFVREHLENCEECSSEYEKLKSDDRLDRVSGPIPETDDSQALVQIKRKIRAKRIRAICIAVLITAVAVFGWFLISWPFSVAVDYGVSERYSRSDMDGAMLAVKMDFRQMQGCKLFSLSYAGDEKSQRELEYQNRDRAPGTEYTDCIVFSAAFRSPILGGGAWTGNRLYEWDWIVAREGNGLWTVLDKGVC